MNSAEKLKRLERLAENLRTKQSVRVTFRDGTARTMSAADVIPLFLSSGQIVSVTGGSKGDGRLVELLAGLIDDAPEMEL